MAEGYQNNPEYYQSGDIIDFGSGTVMIVTASGYGTSVFVSSMVAKKIPTSLTISHSLITNWLRMNGESIDITNATIDVTRSSEDFILLSVSGVTVPPRLVGNISFSGAITFN